MVRAFARKYFQNQEHGGTAMVAGRRRVVITGMGCVTPLGVTIEELWGNLKEGRSGVAATTVFDA